VGPHVALGVIGGGVETPGFVAHDGLRVGDVLWLSGTRGRALAGAIASDRVTSVERVATTTLADDLMYLDGAEGALYAMV